MTKETYEKITDALRKRAALSKGINLANKILTYVIFAAYPCLLVSLFLQNREMLLKAVLVPAVSFAILSVFRRAVNSPRPYEVFGIPPVIPKKTKGKSFPSRHVFSVVIIGMTFLACFPLKGAAVFILAVAAVMGVIRVISGVHFPRDVIVGALFGVVSGIIGFYFI